MHAQSPNMRRSHSGVRTLRAAAALAIAAGLATSASADLISWNTINGSWTTSSNWTGGSVPDINDDVRIGNLPGVQNGLVLGGGVLTIIVDSLEISDGMTLDLNGSEFGTFGNVSITGANSRMILRPQSLGPNAHDFSGRLILGAGAFLEMHDDVPVRLFSSVGSHSQSSGVISGRGVVEVQGNGAFRNDGIIAPDNNGGMSIAQVDPLAGAHAIDLDGLSGAGQIHLTTPFSQLHITASGLSDSFGGTVLMGSGSYLNMNMTDGWTADAHSTFNVTSAIPGAAALIGGDHFSFGGDLNVGGSQGALRVLADATLLPTADVFLGNDDVVEFDGETTVEGGVYVLSDGAYLEFDGPTEVNGGTFTTAGAALGNGSVEFNGTTTWDGDATFNGRARQLGDATVAGSTVINADVFTMRGDGGTTWNINNGLIVNADRIGGVADNNFDGVMNIDGGVFAALRINLTDPSLAWVMNGQMNLSGIGALPVTRVAGSRMHLSGDLSVTGGISVVTADVTFSDAAVDIESGSTLRLRGATSIDSATIFSGDGTLQNGVDGVMLLESGVSLSEVGLTNSGVLRIGQAGAGVAGVDRLTSTDDAAWGVDIGGYLAATEHDVLLVTGGNATLAGILAVTLIDSGAGVFLPEIGDEFAILHAVGGVTGSFANDPVSIVGSLTFEWTVLYNPNSVVLRLDNIVPAPGSLALIAWGGLVAARRRRP